MFRDLDNAKIEGIKDEIHEIEMMLKALIKSLEKPLSLWTLEYLTALSRLIGKKTKILTPLAIKSLKF